MTNPFQFLQQTRSEVAKVVWPGRREVLVTTAMVFVMAVVAAIFFFGVDLTIRTALEGTLCPDPADLRNWCFFRSMR